MLVLAFDTATDVATTALVGDGVVLGERVSEAKALLEAVDGALRDAGVTPADLDAIVVGTGPGSFTSTRIGLAAAQGLALALELPVAGVSTLDALASAAPEVAAGRRRPPPGGLRPQARRVVAPDDLDLDPGTTCIGSGAIRYRETFEAKGAVVPPDDDPVHLPHARLHAALAHDFGPADSVQPIYVRAPDAKARTTA